MSLNQVNKTRPEEKMIEFLPGTQGTRQVGNIGRRQMICQPLSLQELTEINLQELELC